MGECRRVDQIRLKFGNLAIMTLVFLENPEGHSEISRLSSALAVGIWKPHKFTGGGRGGKEPQVCWGNACSRCIRSEELG
jgi:hypothetical protein